MADTADTRLELVGRLTTVTDWSGVGGGGGELIVQTRGYPIPLVREHSQALGPAEENPEHGHYPRNT